MNALEGSQDPIEAQTLECKSDDGLLSVEMVASLLNTTTSMFKRPRQIDPDKLKNRTFTWVETIELERKLARANARREKKERATRLAKLFKGDFENSEEDMDSVLDQ